MGSLHLCADLTQTGYLFCLCFSTLVQVQRAQVRLWPRLAPVWRSFVPLPSLSATATEPATTTATPTASGWQLSNSLKCSGKQLLSKSCMQIKGWLFLPTQCSLVNSLCWWTQSLCNHSSALFNTWKCDLCRFFPWACTFHLQLLYQKIQRKIMRKMIKGDVNRHLAKSVRSIGLHFLYSNWDPNLLRSFKWEYINQLAFLGLWWLSN